MKLSDKQIYLINKRQIVRKEISNNVGILPYDSFWKNYNDLSIIVSGAGFRKGRCTVLYDNNNLILRNDVLRFIQDFYLEKEFIKEFHLEDMI